MTSAISTTTSAATSAQALPQQKTNTLSSDFETFLKLLTTQARYQDPLEPIDSSQYSAQLAQFSMVEQQVVSNDLLTALSAQLGTGGIGQVAGWIGMEARTEAPVMFDGDPITLIPSFPGAAQSAALITYDAQGTEIQRRPIAVSSEPVQWDGMGNNAQPLPDGEYTFAVESTSSDGTTQLTTVEAYARITEARVDVTGPRLILKGGQEITVDQVKALREPG